MSSTVNSWCYVLQEQTVKPRKQRYRRPMAASFGGVARRESLHLTTVLVMGRQKRIYRRSRLKSATANWLASISTLSRKMQQQTLQLCNKWWWWWCCVRKMRPLSKFWNSKNRLSRFENCIIILRRVKDGYWVTKTVKEIRKFTIFYFLIYELQVGCNLQITVFTEN